MQNDVSFGVPSNTQFYFSKINVNNVTLTPHILKANKTTGLDKIHA